MHLDRKRLYKEPAWRLGLLAGGFVSALLITAGAQPPDFDKQLLLESVRSREAVEAAVFHATVEVDVVGPAQALVVPGDRKGEVYRQLNVQDWWVDDQKIAVATRYRSMSWLDDEPIASQDDRPEPRFVYTFDGERAYCLDFRPAGRLLEINARWPYAGSAHPVLFGRAYTHLPFGECLAGGFDFLRTEDIRGRSCAVVQFAIGNERVVAWLARDPPYLCQREEFLGASGLVLSREFAFAQTPSGLSYPVRAVEGYRSPRGEITTTWTVIAFESNPTLPPYVFTPSFDEAQCVVDRATGEVLKGAQE